MKKLLSILCVSALFLVGCSVVDEATRISTDVQKSVNNVAQKAQETVKTVTETKAKIEEKIDQLNTAKNKIEDAAKAVGEIVK
jgi:peptidoglycan hydrolase CwlO-like protein